MPTLKLTKRALDSAAPQETEYFLWDTEVAGFGARIHPSGRCTFVYKCRPGGGRDSRQRKITLGEYRPLTVEQARKEAQRLAGEIATGRDPGAARNGRRAASRAEREAPTVSGLGLEYLDDVRARRKASTAREYTRMWEKQIAPALGSLKVREATTAQVAKLHRSLRQTPYAANRVLALLGGFFAYAERQGLRPKHTNPAHDVEFFPEQARERFLTPDEQVRLGEAIQRALVEGLPPAPTRRRTPKKGSTAKHRPKSADLPRPANPYAVAALRFLLLSGWREMEVLTLKWADVDLERRQALLAETKTGRSARDLSDSACAILTELPRIDGSPFVFPGQDPAQPLREINRLWYAARYAAGLTDVRLHDVRHTFASMMASNGASLLMIGRALGHRDISTTARYAHLLDDPVRKAVNTAANDIASRLNGRPNLRLAPAS